MRDMQMRRQMSQDFTSGNLQEKLREADRRRQEQELGRQEALANKRADRELHQQRMLA